MQPDAMAKLRAMCGSAHDGALLRMSIANALLERDDVPAAVAELREALRFDAGYSAAWKLLGKTLAAAGDSAAAIEAYRSGIAAAIGRGDKQAEKEMTVFLRRRTRET